MGGSRTHESCDEYIQLFRRDEYIQLFHRDEYRSTRRRPQLPGIVTTNQKHMITGSEIEPGSSRIRPSRVCGQSLRRTKSASDNPCEGRTTQAPEVPGWQAMESPSRSMVRSSLETANMSPGAAPQPIPTTAGFDNIIFVFSLGSFIQSAEVTFNWQDSNIGMLANYGNIASTVTVIPVKPARRQHGHTHGSMKHQLIAPASWVRSSPWRRFLQAQKDPEY
ncbi:hypothetical protein DPMN_146564 [Dreissena polymorpha]|uniref:Uncharacterized protein n=1 Tax=Dreissena polymorpha TaxID=45954 RepID=A0A9D4F7A4_DREPO|nr:hypothetical protein DPMN_146564 [Dreissena polymorpha]